MATNHYVRSTDGNDADSGLTWALADAKLGGAGSGANGDTVFFSQVHSETTAGSVVATLSGGSGTLTAPNRYLCGDDSAEPPTALATTAVFASTGNFSLTASAIGLYYGIIFESGAGGSSSTLNLGISSGWTKFEQCRFKMLSTGGFLRAPQNASTDSRVEWKDCHVLFSSATHTIQIGGSLRWNGGSWLSGGTSPTVVFGGWAAADDGAELVVENVDLSNLSSSVNLVAPPPIGARVQFRNCKLPGSWSGSPRSAAFTAPGRIELFNCDSGATNYKLWIEDYCGSIRDETTITRNGGASDGVTPIAWKMVSGTTVAYPFKTLASPEIVARHGLLGSPTAPITVAVEIIRDSATNLKDDEIWLEVQYLGSVFSPKGSRITDCKADVLASSADQTTSSAIWGNPSPGLSNANRQKLSVTFTPETPGYIHARVHLAKTSTTVYVDPALSINGVVVASLSRQVPGGAFVNEVTNDQMQIPGDVFMMENGFGAGDGSPLAPELSDRARFFFGA